MTRSNWKPPPLAEGMARVELGDDYYLGAQWSDWTGAGSQSPSRIFDVPQEQRDRWAAAAAAYEEMQTEITALTDERFQATGYARNPPDGWVPVYQAQP